MKTILKKTGVLFLALVTILAFTFVPIGVSSLGDSKAGVDVAYAGGGADINDLVKIESPDYDTPDTTFDKTNKISAGSILSVSLDELDKTMNGFKSDYNSHHASIQWVLCNDSDFNNSTTIATDTFSLEVSKEYVGKYIYLVTSDDYDTSMNNNTKALPVRLDAFIKAGPSVSSVYSSGGAVAKTIYVNVTGYGEYFTTNQYDKTYESKMTVKIYNSSDKLLKSKEANSGDQVVFTGVPVNYGKNTTIKVKLFMKIVTKDIQMYGSSYVIKGSKLGGNTVRATKLSKKKASLRWGGTAGATGYRVYMGSKLIKTTGAGTTRLIVTKKGAGKAKFKVVPILKSGGKVYAGSSNTVKPGANFFTTSRGTSWRNYKYGRSRFVVKRVSLSGKQYTVKGFFYNTASYIKVKKYKKLQITIYADGKKVASKKYKNLKVNLKASSQKKRTFKFKGKANADLKYGHAYAVVTVITDDTFFNDRGLTTNTDYGY